MQAVDVDREKPGAGKRPVVYGGENSHRRAPRQQTAETGKAGSTHALCALPPSWAFVIAVTDVARRSPIGEDLVAIVGIEKQTQRTSPFPQP